VSRADSSFRQRGKQRGTLGRPSARQEHGHELVGELAADDKLESQTREPRAICLGQPGAVRHYLIEVLELCQGKQRADLAQLRV
jgi:hypothetical protein